MRAGMFVAVLLASAASAGCNSSQLRFTTLKLSRTVPDLQERQVLDNLARIAAEPASLPYYAVISTGSANIQDGASGGLLSLGLQHRVFPAATLDASASRTVTGNWTLNTTSSPDRLRAMRAAYQIALGIGPIDPGDLKKLESFEPGGSSGSIAHGWLCVGGKHDMPKGCRLVAHDGHTYIWVNPDHSKDFADFSLLILDIATVAPSSAPSGPTKISLSIDSIPPIRIGQAPIRSQAVPGQPLQENPSQDPQPPAPALPTTPAIRPRLYEDSPSINRGLFFVPR